MQLMKKITRRTYPWGTAFGISELDSSVAERMTGERLLTFVSACLYNSYGKFTYIYPQEVKMLLI